MDGPLIGFLFFYYIANIAYQLLEQSSKAVSVLPIRNGENSMEEFELIYGDYLSKTVNEVRVAVKCQAEADAPSKPTRAESPRATPPRPTERGAETTR